MFNIATYKYKFNLQLKLLYDYAIYIKFYIIYIHLLKSKAFKPNLTCPWIITLNFIFNI